MSYSTEHIQILFDISMAIGTDVDLRKMVKTALSRYLRNLNCIGGGIYREQVEDDGSLRLEAIHLQPRQIRSKIVFQEAMRGFDSIGRQYQLQKFYAAFPVRAKVENEGYYYLMRLKGFGFLVLLKNDPLDELVISGIKTLNNKLAASCISCFLNRQDQKKLTLLNKELAESISNLKERTARISAIVKTATDGIVTINESGRIESFNPAAEQIFDYAIEEVVDKEVGMLMPPSHPENGDENPWTIQTTEERKNTGLRREVSGRRKDGTIFPMELSVNEVTLAHRRLFTAIVRDISDRVLAEERRQEAYKAGMAESAIAVLHNIGNVITPVGVDLNRLYQKEEFTAIGHYLEKFRQMLEEQQRNGNLDRFLGSDEKGRQMIPFLGQLVEQIEIQVEDERNILTKMKAQIKHIGEIISIQQKYAGFQGPDEVFQLEDVLLDALQMVQPALEKRGIELDMNLSADLAPLKADKNKMVQVLLNLLKNAIESIDLELKRQPDKKPKIRIALFTAEEGRVGLSISENGIGIEKETLPEVFKFGYTTKQRSSGFGLHDCANFLLACNGTIDITSPGAGEGAKVAMTLPTV
ncbi:MAG: PAS domain S-box protein [Proteobacteria bacterium]|nr:PAS domain S-box protein [Pseudomonadota bacterium]